MSHHEINSTLQSNEIPSPEENTLRMISKDGASTHAMKKSNSISPGSQECEHINHSDSYKGETPMVLQSETPMISIPETALPESHIDPMPSDDDPFSPQNLALAQNFGALTETRRLLTSVPVCKPKRESWVRTSSSKEHWIVGSILELKDQNEYYWVTPEFREALVGEPCLKYMRLILSVDRQGNPFFWAIGVPDTSGRSQPWIDSMNQAATQALKKWVRVAWSAATRNYEVHIAEIAHEPTWPNEPISELLKIAFRDRIVSSMEHPVIKSLRGLE